MAEYWQDVLARAQATFTVWTEYFPTLQVGAAGVDTFEGLTLDLPGLAQVRDDAVQAVDEARQVRDNLFQDVRMLDLKVPKIIGGVIDESSGLLDDLDKVFAVTPWSPDKALTRGQLLSPLWASANAYQLAQTPPRPVIVRGAVTQAVFQTKLNALPGMNQGVKTAEEVLNRERGALRRAARDLETLCIRFLKAATGLADEGSAEATALGTIPTQTTSDLPETLGIQTFTQGGSGGLELLVAYEAYALEPDETAVLQYQVLDVDVDWQSTPYDASGNALGPFTIGQTVKVRTRVTNPHGSRDGGPRQLTLITPPA